MPGTRARVHCLTTITLEENENENENENGAEDIRWSPIAAFRGRCGRLASHLLVDLVLLAGVLHLPGGIFLPGAHRAVLGGEKLDAGVRPATHHTHRVSQA